VPDIPVDPGLYKRGFATPVQAGYFNRQISTFSLHKLNENDPNQSG
jgi:hypothetical protein